ncbi:MAG: hypothetical protein V2A34_13295, partial [Lentisphaerota bacterium]
MKNAWIIPVMLAGLFLAACSHRTEKAPPVSSEPLAVQISLSTNVIRIGDLVQATVTADHPAGGLLQWPALGRGKEIIVRDQKIADTQLSTNRIRSTARYQLTSFVTGTHELSRQPVTFAATDGTTLS